MVLSKIKNISLYRKESIEVSAVPTNFYKGCGVLTCTLEGLKERSTNDKAKNIRNEVNRRLMKTVYRTLSLNRSK